MSKPDCPCHECHGTTDTTRLEAMAAREAPAPAPVTTPRSESDLGCIVIDPEIRSGKPTIRGTRITADDIRLYLIGGMTVDDILLDFPQLTQEDVRACLCLDYTAPSKPEPAPTATPQSEDVSEVLIAWLRTLPAYDAQPVIDLVRARRNYGVEKYGTTLQTYNGRDCLEDARQEAGDLLQYVMQARMEGRGEEAWDRIEPVLRIVLTLLVDPEEP